MMSEFLSFTESHQGHALPFFLLLVFHVVLTWRRGSRGWHINTAARWKPACSRSDSWTWAPGRPAGTRRSARVETANTWRRLSRQSYNYTNTERVGLGGRGFLKSYQHDGGSTGEQDAYGKEDVQRLWRQRREHKWADNSHLRQTNASSVLTLELMTCACIPHLFLCVCWFKNCPNAQDLLQQLDLALTLLDTMWPNARVYRSAAKHFFVNDCWG